MSLTSRKTTNFWYLSSLVFFAVFIFLPAVYILKYFTGFNVFLNPLVIKAISYSFLIGLIVTLLNFIFGVPLAWVLARSKNRFVKIIDNLVDLSLVIPTAALGFSIYLFWGTNFGFSRLFGLQDGFISRGPLMIILLHLVFTLPYMIRSTVAAIQQLSASNEEASMTLGASPFAFFRTIAAPLFRDGVINGAVLSFTRSLSETGATMMVAGAFATAPVLIIDLKNQGDLSAAAGASIFLILSAVIVLLAAKIFLGRRKVKLTWALPDLEKTISKLAPLKNAVIFLFFALFIFLPTVCIIFYSFKNFDITGLAVILKSLIFSLGLALLVTAVNLIFSVPFSYLIARNLYRVGNLFDTLSEVVLIIPTSALGLSLVLFWHHFLPFDLLILFLAHLSFTFPLLVKPITAAFRKISVSQEEAAFSLGASVQKTFTSILLPQIKPAIIAGFIMAFMRSLSETGATMAVSKNIKTVTVLIVDYFQAEKFATAAFACSLLFIIAFTFLYFLKKTEKPNQKYLGGGGDDR
jgi:thiamine transport system permease protein